jgi:hypothetical protein
MPRVSTTWNQNVARRLAGAVELLARALLLDREQTRRLAVGASTGRRAIGDYFAASSEKGP